VLQVDTYAHKRSGIAYEDESQRPQKPLLNMKGSPTVAEAATILYQINIWCGARALPATHFKLVVWLLLRNLLQQCVAWVMTSVLHPLGA
jgi:hypothetical protein